MSKSNMVNTRSSHSNDDGANINSDTVSDLDKLQELLKPMQDSLENIQNFFKAKLERQQFVINNLLTRVQSLEEKMTFREHMSTLQARKIDDLEQTSRKVNLRLKGIEVGANDSPTSIMNLIIGECRRLELPIVEREFDRCHRVGPVYFKDDKKLQDVLLKLVTWDARNLLYQNRKQLNFNVYPDLTERRKAILDFARKEVDSGDGAVSRIVSFVFVDLNCKLKFKSKSDKFFEFNSENELLNLVLKLDNEAVMTREWKIDEHKGRSFDDIEDLYY